MKCLLMSNWFLWKVIKVRTRSVTRRNSRYALSFRFSQSLMSKSLMFLNCDHLTEQWNYAKRIHQKAFNRIFTTHAISDSVRNQLLQLCTARTAWCESDQAVRTVHSCNTWWLALLWSDSVIKLVSVLSVNYYPRGYEMLTNGNKITTWWPMKSREIRSVLALTNN